MKNYGDGNRWWCYALFAMDIIIIVLLCNVVLFCLIMRSLGVQHQGSFAWKKYAFKYGHLNMHASTQYPIITHLHTNTRISINKNEHNTLFSFAPSFLFEHWSISWYILFYVNGLIYYHIFWWFWLPFFKHKPLMFIHYIY